MNNLAIPDWINAFNALASGPSVPGVASFDIQWLGGGERGYKKDPGLDRMAFQYVKGPSTSVWSARTPSLAFEFVSDKADPKKDLYSVVGREWNGAFYNQAP